MALKKGIAAIIVNRKSPSKFLFPHTGGLWAGARVPGADSGGGGGLG